MRRLPTKDFVPFAPEVRGTEVRVAHQNCDNGVDHKPRLWIKRNEDGSIAAHCHNCQKHGFFREGKQKVRSIDVLMEVASSIFTDSERIERVVRSIELPSDCDINIPPLGRVWLYNAGLIDLDIKTYNICYSAYLDRVIVPIYNEDNILISYSARAISNDQSPKYLNVKGPKAGMFYSGDRSGDTLVLTEDILSAIRCGKFLPSACDLGVSPDKHAAEIAKNFNSVVIFFDDDNFTVKRRQLQLKRVLEPLLRGSVRIVHSGGIDPKEMTDEQLKEILNVS